LNGQLTMGKLARVTRPAAFVSVDNERWDVAERSEGTDSTAALVAAEPSASEAQQ